MMQYNSKRVNRGFTLMETLVTVLIIICLLAVSMVAVVTYRDYLKISELDNAAREIYMAAQNRAVLLDGRGSLERLTVKQNSSNEIADVEVAVGDGESVSMTFYYISSEDENVGQLLPAETIESSLWNGHFYVVYEPESASVTDVFFAEKSFADGNFEQFYRDYKGASKRERMKLSPMTGYYGGDSAQGGNTIALRTPVIRIYNEDELKAEVTWWVPQSLQSERDKIKLEMTLNYQDIIIKLDKDTFGENFNKRVTEEMPESGMLYLTYKRTYLLDSLDLGLQFKDILGLEGAALGGNFELTAEVSYTGDTQKVNGAKKTVENNSLFAYDEENGDDTIAYIEYLRHLQNLRMDHSNVKNKTQAVQIADIDASRSGEGYNFLPINNEELVSYTVRQKPLTESGRFEIRNLHVETAEGSAGLFGGHFAVTTPSEGGIMASFAVEGVRLVNASVSTTAPGGYAGALAGQAGNALFRDCQVYWEIGEQGQTNLQYLLGNNVSGYRYQEKGIYGKYAGGLAGSLTNSGIVDSFASTLVEGTSSAGGLAGKAETLAVQHSYADCYVQGGSAAGLVGETDGSGSRLTDCYSAGFLNGAQKEGGFCLGTGSVEVKGSYSAMFYSHKDGEDQSYSNHYPLCEGSSVSYDENTHYLFSSYVRSDTKEMDFVVSSQALMGAAEGSSAIGRLFGEGSPFGYVNVSGSHPYNLQTELSLSRYPYPAFADMGHYGDWLAEFSEGSLVYWEQYSSADDSTGNAEGEYRFEGANLNLLKDEAPVGDGYAVALKAKENQAQLDVTIEYAYQTADGEKKMKVFYSLSGEVSPDDDTMAYATLQAVKDKDETYYLAPLPEEIVCSDYASADFYQKLSFQILGTEGVTGAYYYSPHFAATMIEYDETANVSALAKNLTVRVRTPRHLYELSCHKEYYASRLGLAFQQELDLDYEEYTAYKDKDDHGLYRTANGAEQGAIGKNAGSPFRCTYYGGCHVISNVIVNESGSNIGLFGYNMGTIRDTVYLSKPDQPQILKKTVDGHETAYIGGLVGYNNGTVHNCAVADMGIQTSAFEYSTIYAGGLVGINYGSVTGSSAAMKYIATDANNSHAYLGGFAGKNAPGGTIRNCYAVGRVAAARSRYGNVVAAGFAGGNQGTVRNNYAATALTVSGEAVAYGFCADNTGSSNFYLNGGTYRYDGKEYALQYEDGGSIAKAQPQTYTPMTADKDADGSVAKIMDFESGAPKYGAAATDAHFPYPAVVRDAEKKVIHYGQWPEMLTLGTVGVCYWEKEVTQVGQSTNEAYHFSAIIVTPGTNGANPAVERISTLCTEHNDGGVIKEYGYGYLYDVEPPELVTKTTQNASQGNVNATASQKLREQTENRYHFVVFTTRQKDEGGDNGLYLKGMERYDTWTLVRKNGQGQEEKYQFYVNPFFGDALAFDNTDKSVTASPEVPKDRPGSGDTVPYEVRSVRQLTYINWNYKSMNTETVLAYSSTTGHVTWNQFPYLSYHGGSFKDDFVDVKDIWKQTHDLNGEHEKYTPIAEFYDSVASGDGYSAANLWGWFGGTYDGSDYVIADYNIQGHASSCVGLFGAVYNGTLSNIILYSSDGQAFVTSTDEQLKSCWFGMGVLAGLAASETGSAVKNCSVAGYTVNDQHRKVTAAGDPYNAWGGSGVGGLLGISSMELVGCSAVTTIKVTGNESDNVRIGGLVGTCQKSISNCYAGGEIISTGEAWTFVKRSNGNTEKEEKGVYIGGIVGGIYMRQLEVGKSGKKIGGSGKWYDNKAWEDPLTNALNNCYSYVILPNSKEVENGKYIKALYAIGGSGDINLSKKSADRGKTLYSNCYFLRDTVLSKNGGEIQNVLWNEYYNGSTFLGGEWKTANGIKTDIVDETKSNGYDYDPAGQVHALTYEEMSDGTLLEHLHNGGAAAFSTVTVKTEDGNRINGKYSFATSGVLNGLNYPFPTILTQANSSYSGDRVNVHYGNWPLDGIERENGNFPVNIDLFADYQETESDGSGGTVVSGVAQEKENVWLSDLAQLAGTGTFTVSCANVKNEEDAGGTGTGSTEGSGNGTGTGSTEGSGTGTGTGDGGTGTGSSGDGTEQELPAAEAFFCEADGKETKEWKIDDVTDKVPLVVRGLREGMAQMTVSYTPDKTDISVPALTVTVNVTAELQLMPGEDAEQGGDVVTDDSTQTGEDTGKPEGNDGQSAGSGDQTTEGVSTSAGTRISMLTETVVFTNERSDVNLYSFDSNGNPLPESLKNQIQLNVTNVSSIEDAYLSGAAAANQYKEDGVTQVPCQGALSVESRGLTGSTSVIVEYEYTYNEKTYQASSTVIVEVKELEASAEPVELYLDEPDSSAAKYDLSNFSFLIAGTLAEGIEPEVTEIIQGSSQIAYATKDEEGMLQVTAGDMRGETTITLFLRFEYEGSSHEVTVYLNVIVYESRMTVASEAVADGTLYLYPGSENMSAVVEAQLNERGKSAEFTWELSSELVNYVKVDNPTSYPAAAQEVLSQSAEPQIANGGASEMNATEVLPQSAGPQAEGDSVAEIIVSEAPALSTEPQAAGDSAAEIIAPEAPEAASQSAELQIEEVQAVRHQSADGAPEEELIIEAEEVVLPEGDAASADLGAGAADTAADGASIADAEDGIADGAASADNIVEETADSASDVGSFDSFYSPQLVGQADGLYSYGGAALSLTEAAALEQPVSGTLTVKAVIKMADNTEQVHTRTLPVEIVPNMSDEKLTAFLAVEDVDNVLLRQSQAYEEAKKARENALPDGGTVEPYTELIVQDTTLRAIEVKLPLLDQASQGEQAVESIWLAVLPRRAVSTIEDQMEKNPDLTEDEKNALETRLLPEQQWKAELDASPQNSWEKDWGHYQVTSAEAVIEQKKDSDEKYVKLIFTWSICHEPSARTVTYSSELLPEALIRVKPEKETAEAEQLESAGVDENGVAYYELEFGGDAEGGEAGEAPEGSETGEAPEGGETGTEATGQQTDIPAEDQNIVDGDPADGTMMDSETQPDVIIDSGTESMQPGTEFFEDIGTDPVISETGDGLIVQEIEMQTYSNEPELFAEDAEIADF